MSDPVCHPSARIYRAQHGSAVEISPHLVLRTIIWLDDTLLPASVHPSTRTHDLTQYHLRLEATGTALTGSSSLLYIAPLAESLVPSLVPPDHPVALPPDHLPIIPLFSRPNRLRKMSIPYGLWGTIPTAPLYNVPNMLPSSRYAELFHVCLTPPLTSILPSLLVTNPAGAIRDYAEHVMSGDRRSMAPAEDVKRLEEWCKNEEYRKVIVEVVKSRLDLGWPYNYKALDVCGVLPVGDLLGVLEQLTKLNESAASVEGAAEIKKLAKPLVDKANGEKKKQEEEEFAKAASGDCGDVGWAVAQRPGASSITAGQRGLGRVPLSLQHGARDSRRGAPVARQAARRLDTVGDPALSENVVTASCAYCVTGAMCIDRIACRLSLLTHFSPRFAWNPLPMFPPSMLDPAPRIAPPSLIYAPIVNYPTNRPLPTLDK